MVIAIRLHRMAFFYNLWNRLSYGGFFLSTAAHHTVSNNLQNELVTDLTSLFGKVLSYHPGTKRSTFTDALSSLGSGLANFFQPHIQAVQQVHSVDSTKLRKIFSIKFVFLARESSVVP